MSKLELPNKSKPYILAHRGNRAACPENTLAAFRRAIADGADLIETDLRLTADGTIVCIHDETVDRTTGGSGAVNQMTLDELKTLSAGCNRPEFADERIPTLAELLDILPEDMAVALELKTDRFLEEAVCKQLIEELEDAGVRERAVVISFSMARVWAVRRVARDVVVGCITLNRPWPYAGAELQGPFWPLLFLNPFYVWLAHRRGAVVCPLDPTPDARLWYYKALGCDAVLTDDPAATARALGRK